METAQPVRHKKNNRLPIPKIAVAAAIVIIGAALSLYLLNIGKTQSPNKDAYQAVFLDNNQVFFGKLKSVDGKYLTLESAYYTKSQDLPANATPEQKAATSSNVSLVKVGDEVYGPENTMQIRAEKVLFWQNLSSDSKVTKAINDAK